MPNRFIISYSAYYNSMAGMAVGVIFRGKTIKGSCGGLNAIGDADKCLVCNKDIDPDSPLKDRLNCPRARKMMQEMST